MNQNKLDRTFDKWHKNMYQTAHTKCLVMNDFFTFINEYTKKNTKKLNRQSK